MHSPASLTRKRIGNEDGSKKRIKLSMNGVMEQSIAYLRFVDITRLWVVDTKIHVLTMRILTAHQVRVQVGNLIT